MSDNTGGTVTYHRADWHTDGTWAIRFTEDGPQRWVSWAEGEAMGLTVPEPPPLAPVDVIAGIGVKFDGDKPVEFLLDRYDASMVIEALAEAGYDVVLRDARQDPQPTVDLEPPTPCGDIDFDALPIGTVLTFNSDMFESTIVRQLGGWRNVANGSEDIPTDPAKWKIAYFPPPLSPGECLRGLLAGRDDADELIEYAAETWPLHGRTPYYRLTRVIGDAAREVH